MDEQDMRFKIAAARRMLHREGCDSTVGGHVSARAEGEDAFHITPFEYFDQTTPNRVVKFSMNLDLLEGDMEASPAVRFHSEFYQLRPDVNSVIHTHSRHVSTFSSAMREIGMYNVASVLFHKDQAVYEDDGTRPPVEGSRMVEVMDGRNVVLIKNHGAVILADSLEKATIKAMVLETAARYHMECEAIGGTEMAEAEVVRSRGPYHAYYLPQMWKANFDRLRRSDPDLFEWVSMPSTPANVGRSSIAGAAGG